MQRLQALIDANTRRYSEAMVGQVVRVLVEGPSKKDAGDLQGRAENNRVVNFAAGTAGASLIGQLLDLTITHSFGYSLRGELVATDTAHAAAPLQAPHQRTA